MLSLNIYQTNQFDIEVRFPETWNELHQHEIDFIARQLLTEQDGATARAYIIQYIIGCRAKNLPDNWFMQIDPEQMAIEIYPITDFIFSHNDLTNPPDAVRLAGVLHHPQSFDNITCGEFEDCEPLATLFADEPSPDLLAKLAAILFRPKIKDEVEMYMKYNAPTAHYYTYQHEKKSAYFKELAPERLYAIFIWYAGCRAQLPLMFPTVYEGSGGNAEPDMMAFTKCIHSGAGVKNGSREKIRTTKLYEFMYEMEQEAIKNNEIQAQYDAMNKT